MENFPWEVIWIMAALWAVAFAGITSRRAHLLELGIQALADSLAHHTPDTIWAMPAGWSDAFELQCYWLPPEGGETK